MGMRECSKKLPISPPDPQECFVKSMKMLVQANIQLFGLSVQNTDKCTSFCNKLYNYLDLMYLLNTSYVNFLHCIPEFKWNTDSVGVLVLHCGHARYARSMAEPDRNGLFERKYKAMLSIEVDVFTTNSTTTLTIREQLGDDWSIRFMVLSYTSAL